MTTLRPIRLVPVSPEDMQQKRHTLLRPGTALAAGEMVLCPRCQLPRSGRLVAIIEQREIAFVPEQYCACG